MQTKYLFGTKAVGTELTPEEDVRLLHAVGFDAFFTAWSPERIPDYRAAADRYGLVYRSVHAACKAHRIWISEELGEVEVTKLLGQIDLVSSCGIPVLVVHPSVGSLPYAPTKRGYERFGRILDAAESRGVTVAFENMSNDAALDALLTAFPSAGYCYDTGHALAYCGGRDYLSLYGNRLCHTHIHDNLGQTGVEPDAVDDLHLLPFDGKVDWDAVAEGLAKVSFRGILMSEVKYTPHLREAYGDPSLEAFYTLVHERLERLARLVSAQ